LFLKIGGGVALARSSSASEPRRTHDGMPIPMPVGGGGLKGDSVGGALAGGAGPSAEPVERRKKLFKPRDRGRYVVGG
jgi:hypothetical protein